MVQTNLHSQKDSHNPMKKIFLKLTLVAAFCSQSWFICPNLQANDVRSQDAAMAKKALTNIKRVVFLGDSITQSGDYVVDIDCWLLAHGIHTEILNLGLGSETATELSQEENAGHVKAHKFGRPCISERLDRVLKMTHPDLLFVCYGMNDGGSLPSDTPGLARFSEAITRLRETALQSGVQKVVLCTPPVHDAKGKTEQELQDKNLTSYTDWLNSKKADGWEVIDFHTPMRKTLDAGRAADPTFALAKDGTHPNREGHWLMAKEILQGYFGAQPIANSKSEDVFLSHGDQIRPLVRERLNLRFNAWMTRIRHTRPGVPGGPAQPESIDDATFTTQLREIDQKILGLLNSNIE